MGFYDLTLDERITLTNAAIREKRTLVERWSAMGKPEARGWDARAEKAAEFLAGCSSVGDIGCGTMQLEAHLPAEVRYVPIDVVSRDARTIVADLNREPLPALDVEGWAMLGLLEYLFDVPGALAQIRGLLVASYNPVDLYGENRRAHAWVNDYSTDQIEAVFAAAGWRTIARERIGRQLLWKLAR